MIWVPLLYWITGLACGIVTTRCAVRCHRDNSEWFGACTIVMAIITVSLIGRGLHLIEIISKIQG